MRKDVKNPGIGTGGLNRIKTRCINGHPLRGSNVWLRITGNRKERRCKTCSRVRGIQCRIRLKQRVVQKLGGRCAWSGCKIVDIDVLTLDHIKDDGAKFRVRGLTAGDATYRQVFREGCPKSRYQILCANHNLKKEVLRRRVQS